jgi:hypothetical protein
MPLDGSLSTMPVPELLMWISQFQKTGTLEIQSRGDVQKVAFDQGKLIFSSSSDRRGTLGRMLIEKGLVSEEMHEKAFVLRGEKSVAVAKALRDLGALPEAEGIRILGKKAEKDLFDLFERKEGSFHFDEAEMPELDLLPLRIDVSRLLLRITQQMDEKGEFDFDASGIRLQMPTDV